MNQITEIPHPAQSEQVGREQVGEVLAAWPVAPGALLLLGWQETAPPAEGTAQLERRRADRGPFRCLTWPRTAGSHAFLAAVRLPPATEPQPGQLLVLHGTETLPLLARLPAAFDPAPAFAGAASRLAGPHGGSVARFLCDMFPAAALSCVPAFGEMLAAFLDRVCADDGCVELAGSVPEGCTFLQGWGRPHADADADTVLVGERVSRHPLQVARFDRPDIVAPATGSLLILPAAAAADLPGLAQLYLLTDQGVWRRKLVERRMLGAEESASHLRAKLPSLTCPPRTADCLRASLKPRFEGRDTLHDRGRPVRAGIDLAVAAGGGCYLTGWLFDPADLVAAVHLHGGACPPSGVRLDTAWTRVARMDVTDAFAAEPSLPRPQHHDHGFAAFAPAAGPARPTPLHLAVTFRDGHVAFLPLTVCDGADAAVRSRMLASVDLHKPSGLAVIERQLGPAFHALRVPHGAAEIAFTTAPRPDARHAIVVPLLDEPVLPRMVLSGFLIDRLAGDETLVLVCGAVWGAAKLDELRRRLVFYGLPAIVLQAPAATGVEGALAMAAAVTRADDFLLLGPATVGASPGWRAALRAGAAAHGPLACACPTLLYEDWSVRWAGDAAVQRLDTAPYVTVRQGRAGLPAASVGGASADAPTLGTLVCCLIPRAALALAAGGAARVTPFGQETGFFLSLAAAGIACRWVPDARAYAVDDAAERPTEPGVGHLIDGWCLRESLPTPPPHPPAQPGDGSMRVLIVSHGHPAFSIGGAEIASHNLFRALNAPGLNATRAEAFYLARTGHPVRRHAATPLMSLRQGEREVFLHADAWDPFWLSNGALDDLGGGFAEYLRTVAPDVVHFHHVIGLGLEAILQVRRALPGAAIVITFHEYLSICLNHGQMVKTTRNTLCRRASPADCASCFPQHAPGLIFQRERFIKEHLALADAYVSPSRFLIDRYAAWGLPPERFRMIENGLDARPPAPPRALPPDGRRDRFGYFGQITAFKGLDVLLDAVSRVPEQVWDRASLAVYGGNLEQQQPQDFRDRFGVLMERVGRRARFFGSYTADELPGLMAGIDWTVVPSIWWENSPLVIQEALLHRRPPIVSGIGGMAEKVRDGIDGLHFRVASPEDLADRLTEALTDPGLWARLSAEAPRPPDLAQFAGEHIALYDDVLDARRQSARAGRALLPA